MAGFYSNRAGAKLKDLLEQVRNETGEDRLNLAEEVDVSRALCDKAVHIFDICCIQNAEQTTVDQKNVALSCLKDALTHVGQMVERHAKVLTLSDSIFDPGQVAWVVETVQKILKTHLEDEYPMLLKQILVEFDRIKVPEKANVNIVIV